MFIGLAAVLAFAVTLALGTPATVVGPQGPPVAGEGAFDMSGSGPPG